MPNRLAFIAQAVVLLVLGTLLIGLGISYCWDWFSGGAAYPKSIAGSPGQLYVMLGGLILLGCGLLGAGIGSWKQARLEGLFLGLIGGPLGVIAAFIPDNRPKCPQCSGRYHKTSRSCPRCQAVFALRKPETQADADAWDNRSADADQRQADWMAGGRKKGK
jgi:hypothetical protein